MRTTRDRGLLVAELLQVTADFLQVPTAVFYAQMAGSGRLRAADSVGLEHPPPDLGPGEGVAGRAAASQAVVATGGAMAVPVHSGGRPFGVLAFSSPDSHRRFDDDEQAALVVLVGQAESAIETSFLHDETARLALTDGLTGLWNRRHFDLKMASELSRAVRFSEPFAIVFADIDHFKMVNDHRGHQAGDTVLIEVARRLSEVTREVDVVARYGGEEFALLLPRTGVPGALRLAEKIRDAVAASPFVVDDVPVDVTISVGVAAYPDHGPTGKEVMRSADQALYEAKAAGRNQVRQAADHEEGTRD